MNLVELSNKVSESLLIDKNIILNILKEKNIDLNEIIPPEKIQENFTENLELKQFEESLKSNETKNLFNELKTQLGLVKINNFIKKEKIITRIREADKSTLINDLIKILNERIKTVNQILKENLTQTGGNLYFLKYKKYKEKYLKLKSQIV
jgi:hypothetical protein